MRLAWAPEVEPRPSASEARRVGCVSGAAGHYGRPAGGAAQRMEPREVRRGRVDLPGREAGRQEARPGPGTEITSPGIMYKDLSTRGKYVSLLHNDCEEGCLSHLLNQVLGIQTIFFWGKNQTQGLASVRQAQCH